MKSLSILLFGCLLFTTSAKAQFLDEFEDGISSRWDYFTGDGVAEMEFTAQDGIARITVDATQDPNNVWWAIIKRNVADELDLEQLAKPGFELRVEAKVRIHNAPKRVNFMINTQRTTDFHEHLREYDIASNGEWKVISFTTQNLDVKPGDDLNVQLGVTDFGYQTYVVDMDYYKAEVVEVRTSKPDVGEPLVYHPPLAPLSGFEHKLEVHQSSLINTEYPDVNFSNWKENLTVYSTQWAILKWDFDNLPTNVSDGPGILELTTHFFQSGGEFSEVYGEELGIEFGKVRIIEILGGDSDWSSETVTYSSLTQGEPYEKVFNTQMIFDTEVASEKAGKTYITLSRPVMQRLLDGTTKGLLIRPLGAVVASFDSSENAPILYVNVVDR